jgi:hypothetical protein
LYRFTAAWGLLNAVTGTPVSEAACSIHVGAASVIVADLGCEKFQNALRRRLYVTVNVDWEAAKGWKLWRSTTDEDRYVIHKLHVCLTDTQAEFDEQNLLLAKLLNDYLNEAEIVTRLATNPPPNGGLNRFEQWLVEAGFPDADHHLRPLRTIQKLRSTGASSGSMFSRVLPKSLPQSVVAPCSLG